MNKEARIKKVMTSNYLYTLFFDNFTSLEINKTKFRGTRRPHAGDLFKLTEKSLPDGKTESRMFLNGNEVKGQLL